MGEYPLQQRVDESEREDNGELIAVFRSADAAKFRQLCLVNDYSIMLGRNLRKWLPGIEFTASAQEGKKSSSFHRWLFIEN